MSEVPSAPAAGKVVPYIPASKSLPELTIGVLLLGATLSIILAGANAYLGMFAGMTVSASVPAAVISMAIFKLIRRGNILQNNGVQTAAASGEGLAAGVIFTLPALIILGVWAEFSYLETTLIAGFGGVLGVLFTIPLRRSLIIDQPLQFPEGVATAEVLKAGASGGGGVILLVIGGAIGGIVKLGGTGLKLWTEIVEWSTYIGGTVKASATGIATATSAKPFYFGLNASPALLAVGYIVGFNVATVIFAGAVMNRWVAMPLFAAFGDPSLIIINPDIHAAALALDPAVVSREAAALVGTLLEALKDRSWVPQALGLVDPWQFVDHGAIAADPYVRAVALSGPLPDVSAAQATAAYHGSVTRYLGVGGMLVGGMWSLFKLRRSLLGGITAGLDAYKRARMGGGASEVPRTERDMPMNIILIAIVACMVPLFFIFHHFTGSLGVSMVMAIVVIVAGFLFSAVASYMAGLVGSSNNPVSGITISTILVSALLLLAMGLDSKAGPVAAILIGGVVCCAAAIGGDNLQDLKCGQLVGSTPWKQQTMQILGVVVAAFMMAPLLNLLHKAYTIGSPGLPAPQANLMGTVAKGVFAGGLPWTIIGVGAAIAVAVIILDSVLGARGAKFRVPVMAFAVGVYLPFDLNVPIFLGGVVAWMVSRAMGGMDPTSGRRGEIERNGLLISAGFITGEALMGIVLAVPVAAAHDANVLALAGGKYHDLMWPALMFVGVVLVLLYKMSFRHELPKAIARDKS